MVSFCADIDRLFTELPFLERCKAAKENGFASVEFTFPEKIGMGELGDAAAYKGLKVSVITVPEQRAAHAFEKKSKQKFLDFLDDLLDKADFLGCKKLYVPAKGLPPETFEAQREAFASALHAVAPRVRRAGIKILLGFKNPREMPDAYPSSTLEVLELLDELNDNKAFGYLFDVYQTQSCEGGLSNTIDSLISLIGHVRIAGVPMGEEPDTGEVNYDYLLSLLETQGYQGHIGCSYTPRLKTADGLKWIQKYV
ncbi:MAG: TIM barrel protein [Alphaproteobacteria bacterium]|nr:TIM barrel protein [Alphaproteobacteria bacterium]